MTKERQIANIKKEFYKKCLLSLVFYVSFWFFAISVVGLLNHHYYHNESFLFLYNFATGVITYLGLEKEIREHYDIMKESKKSLNNQE